MADSLPSPIASAPTWLPQWHGDLFSTSTRSISRRILSRVSSYGTSDCEVASGISQHVSPLITRMTVVSSDPLELDRSVQSNKRYQSLPLRTVRNLSPTLPLPALDPARVEGIAEVARVADDENVQPCLLQIVQPEDGRHDLHLLIRSARLKWL